MYTIGVDLGGTNIKAALVDEHFEIVQEAVWPTKLPRPAQAICDDIARMVQSLADKAGVKKSELIGIGIGCPGTVDAANGVVLYSNNLGWHNFAMGAYLAAQTGLPVTLGNDANVAALGEAAVGCAKGAESAVILTLGTGVGGGVVLGGRLLTGFTGAASEPGHMVIVPDGEPCTCGRRGCLESYASATALVRMTKQAAQNGTGNINGRTAFELAARGDAAAQGVVDAYVRYLSLGIANLINIFFPEVIGLSGGVANQGEELLAKLRTAVAPQVFGHDFAHKSTKLVCCTLGYNAGMVGAAVLAKQNASAAKTV